MSNERINQFDTGSINDSSLNIIGDPGTGVLTQTSYKAMKDYFIVGISGSGGNVNTGSLATTSSLNSFTASYYIDSASFNSNISNIIISGSSINTGSLLTTASFNVFTSSYLNDSSSFNNRIISITGSAINTGSLLLTSSFNLYTSSTNIQISNIYASESNYILTSSFIAFTSSYSNDSSSFNLRINNATGSITSISGTVNQIRVTQSGNTTTLFLPTDIHLSGSMMIGSTSAVQWGDNGIAGTINGYLQANDNGLFTLSNNASNDFKRIMLGGSTNVYPAISRSGSGIAIQLADTSSLSDLTVRHVNVSGNLTFNSSVGGIINNAGTLAIVNIMNNGGGPTAPVFTIGGDRGMYSGAGGSLQFTAGSGVQHVIINRTNGGLVGIATPSQVMPTARLQIGAGTTTAGTAPIKLTSGSLLTTLESGSIEFGSHLYITIGITRYQLDNQLSAGGKRTTVADAAYFILTTDYLVAYTSLTTARTITLPTAIGISGQQFIIKDESGNAAISNLTLVASGSQNIDGSNSKIISSSYGSLSVYSNGANWFTW